MTTALIIDDNDLNLETMRVLLKIEGVEAITVSSPNDVNASVSGNHDINVVFLDLELPNCDGIEFINDLRAMPQLTNVPIVAYTVHISELNEVRDAGFDGLIGKPLNPQAFPTQLERILNGETIWEVGQ